MKDIGLSMHYEIGDAQTPLEKIRIRSSKLPDDEACLVPVGELREYAVAISTLTARVAELEEALVEEREGQLWGAFHAGIVRPDGKWITGGISDAEWLMRELGASLKVPQDPEAISKAIPVAARKALKGGDA